MVIGWAISELRPLHYYHVALVFNNSHHIPGHWMQLPNRNENDEAKGIFDGFDPLRYLLRAQQSSAPSVSDKDEPAPRVAPMHAAWPCPC